MKIYGHTEIFLDFNKETVQKNTACSVSNVVPKSIKY